MTRRTTDAFLKVNAVIEVGGIRQVVNANPFERLAGAETRTYRLEIRAIGPDLFVAIHADAWKNRHAEGVSVFALSSRGATSEAARWLAQKENQSELMGGVALQDKSHMLQSVLINLSQTATIRSSLFVGHDLLSQIKSIAHLHHSKVEQAAFVVLKSPDIPSLLIETGFLSNHHEESKLRRVSYQQALANAMMQGIEAYFEEHPKRH